MKQEGIGEGSSASMSMKCATSRGRLEHRISLRTQWNLCCLQYFRGKQKSIAVGFLKKFFFKFEK